MKPLTPMEAQRRLDYARKHGMHMSAEHRRAMETIANMREEWVVIYDYKEADGPATFTINQVKDSADRPLNQHTAHRLAEEKLRAGYANVRVVYRYVTEMKEA